MTAPIATLDDLLTPEQQDQLRRLLLGVLQHGYGEIRLVIRNGKIDIIYQTKGEKVVYNSTPEY